MIILPGPASQDLAKRLVAELKTRLVPVFFKKFPDGESYIRIEGDVQDRHVIVVQTTSPPQDERMMQLFLLASAAKKQGAQRITAVVPYFAYGRQDKIFLPGEAFSIKTVIDILKACGVTQIITINAHNPIALEGLKRCSFAVDGQERRGNSKGSRKYTQRHIRLHSNPKRPTHWKSQHRREDA